MAGGLAGLLDDVAAFAKLAAASIDDVGAAAGRAGVKAAGVVVDDTAVTPAYVHGLAAERELPIIKKIARGSLRNKLVLILPAALILSQLLPVAIEIILMVGGVYLCFEAAHKLRRRTGDHATDHPTSQVLPGGAGHEDTVVAGAVRTDLVLSAEIMIISLKEVLDYGLVARTAILLIVAIVLTVAVYGVVALIVKMDDAGVYMARSPRRPTAAAGRRLVTAMPIVLALLSVVGTAAMAWVGGHILLAGVHELGLHGPLEFVEHLEHLAGALPALGSLAAWLVGTIASALTGVIIGVCALVGYTAARHLARRAAPHSGS